MLARGDTLRRGEFVLLGSLTPYQPIAGDGVIRAGFGAAGSVALRASGTGDAPLP
jgi:2-keto-4-pentenoate hydratase